MRTTSAPEPITFEFAGPQGSDGSAEYVLKVESDGVASGIVTFNGAGILAVRDFRAGVFLIERPISLASANRLTVELRSAPGTTLKVSIVGRDSRAPRITATVTPAPNTVGWHRTPPTVTYICTDGGSGIAACPSPVTVTTEGAGQVVTGIARDLAGNTAQASVTINLDTTPPTAQHLVSPAATEGGWHNTPADSAFACQDSVSGVAVCPAAQRFAADGAGQVHAGVVVDRAGNETAVRGELNLDLSPPSITSTVTPPAGPSGWRPSPATVTFACEDGGSGIASCPAPVVLSSEGAEQEVIGAAVDRAGNQATASVRVSVDGTAPTIAPTFTPLPNAAGWWHTPVTVSFTCDDGTSGVEVCPAPVTVSNEGPDQAVAATVSDRAGNSRELHLAVNIDTTAPVLTAQLSALPNDAGWHRSPVTVTWDCSDSGSGLDTCATPATVVSDTAGELITGNAADRAGNAASATITVKLDTQPPSIQAVVGTADPVTGAVTVSFVCDDALSGIRQCAAPQTLPPVPGPQVIAGEASDHAGNTAATSVTVTVEPQKPTISATLSRAANAAGWHNGPVVVTFTCAADAGVQSCTAPVTLSSEGSAQVVTGTVIDNAGNTATATVTLNIDLTPPTIASPARSTWSRGDVDVAFTCGDTLSGVAACPSPIRVTGDGAHVVSGVATDLAGNSAQLDVTVRIDNGAPVVAAIAERAPNAAGWYNAPVSVRFECEDAGSGVAACPEPITVSADGPSQAVTGVATDAAGNTASATIEISLDRTPPSLQVQTPAQWTNGDTLVTFVCADATSGVDACPAPMLVTASGETVVERTITDRAGNSVTAQGTVRIDRTLPTITTQVSVTPGSSGWYREPVTVTFTCADDVSPVATCPEPVNLASEGAGQVVAGTVRDAAGNQATASLTLNLDLTPPTIVGTAVPSTAWSNSDVTVTFTCLDAASGVAVCPAPVAVSAEGINQAVTGEARDHAGHAASATVIVSIDRTAPTVTAGLQPAPNAAGWHLSDVLVTFTCADPNGAGIIDCPPPFNVSSEGAGQRIVRTVTDAAGNAASGEVTINLDATAPIVQITSPAPDAVVRTGVVTITGSVADALSGLQAVTCGGAAAVLTGTTFTCERPLAAGPNTVEVRVVDRAGNVGTAAWSGRYDQNAAPVAHAGGPYTAAAQTTLMLDGSQSRDPEGQPLAYAWRFHDGSIATGVRPSKHFTQAGTFTVELTATDTAGASHVATAQITITAANRAPTASAGGPYAGDAGVPITFNGSGSDPDNDTLIYAWSFGDGTTGSGAAPRKTYTKSGTMTVTLTVSDGRGGQAQATTEVVVRAANQRPTARMGGPYAGTANSAIAFNGAASSDPDKDPLIYTWTFGDGGAGTGATPTHIFAASGSYTVTLTVTDGRGGTDAATTQVTIGAANSSPTAAAGGPYTGEPGVPVTFNGSASVDPDGDVLTYAWTFGDGVSRTGASPSHTYAHAGTYTVTLTVADGRGGSHTATTTATMTAPDPGVNRSPIARITGSTSGEAGLALAFNGGTSTDPDNDALTYAWSFGDGSDATGAAVSHAWHEPGDFAVTLTVTDARGASHAATHQVAVAAAADRAPPTLSVSGPRNVLPGADVTLVAAVSDNRGVASVTFTRGGEAPVAVTGAPYQFTTSTPAVASPGTVISITVVARDVAGNEASTVHELHVAAEPDTTPPSISLRHPATIAPASAGRLSATASDVNGVSRVTFYLNGAMVGTAAAEPYVLDFTVPAGAGAGASLSIAAEAEDHAGNRARAAGVIVVSDTTASIPPSVTLQAPAQVAPGSVLLATAVPGANTSLALAEFSIDGAVVASPTASPFEARYQVPQGLPSGTTLQVAVTVTDFAGLTETADASVLVTADAAASGLITGEVYDDRRGLPIEGATISLLGEDASGAAYDVHAVSDARGRYTLSAVAGVGQLHISKPGWTSAWRSVAVTDAEVTEAIDARLTQRTSLTAVSSVLGATLSDRAVELEVPAGASATDAALSVTAISGQGLAGVLPLGWTPVGAADVAPAETTLAVPATLRASGVIPATTLVLARWDADARVWRAVAQTIATGDAAVAQIDRGGQYAWLRADVEPVAPATPAVGEPVSGVAALPLPQDASAIVNPSPAVIFYEPGVSAEVAGTLEPSVPLPSGTRLHAYIAESYQFFSGASLQPEPYVQDLFFYQGAAAPSLQAVHTVTPSYEFEALSLETGVIRVELREAGAAGDGASVVGSSGGRVTADTGESLDIGAGQLEAAAAVQVAQLAAANVGAPLPAGFTYVGGAVITLSGAGLSGSATLSVPRPTALQDTATVLVFRVVTAFGRSTLEFAAVGALTPDSVTARSQLASGVPLPGIRTNGRYVFLRADAPVGFVAGYVLTASGQPSAHAIVSTDTLPEIVANAHGANGYAVVARAGTLRVDAVDPVTADAATASLVVAAGAEGAVDLRLAPQPPRIVSITPAAGATQVPLSGAITIVFSKAIDPGTVSDGPTQRLTLARADGAVLAGVISLSSGNTVVTFRPAQPLLEDTEHTFTVEQEVADGNGRTLDAPLAITFRSIKVTPPEVTPGVITASIPADGTSLVTAPAGTASPHDTVTVENLTTGLIVRAQVQADGSFSQTIAAVRTDRLQLRLVDTSGNVTIVAIDAFAQDNANGSRTVWVNPEGGRVTHPSGIAVDVPVDAFPNGAAITLRPVLEAQFPFAFEDKHKDVYSYSGGVELDLGGETPRHYLNISVPATGGETARDQWVVVQSGQELSGSQALHVIDTARVIANQIRTSSPPCPGVTGSGTYGFLKAARPLGVLYGSVSTMKELPPGVFVPFLVPAPGVLSLPTSTNPSTHMDNLSPYVSHAIALAEAMPRPVCLPMLSGRVTMTRNTVRVVLPTSQLLEGDVEVVLTNVSRGTEQSFYPPFTPTFAVEGAQNDSIRGQIINADGTSRLFPVQVQPVSYVRITIPGTEIAAGDTDIIVTNETKNVQWSSGLNSELRPRFDTNVIIEGELADVFRVTASNPGSVIPRTLAFSRNVYSAGTGNLLVKALPGSIDPTWAEIDAANAQLPPEEQLAGPGVHSVSIEQWRTENGQSSRLNEHVIFDRSNPALSALATGAFVQAIEGDFGDAYRVRVYYEDREGRITKSIDEVLPNFRIEVRDPATGQLRKTLAGQVPPRDQPLAIDVGAAGDAGEVTSDLDDLVNVDPRTPIALTFSQPLDPATVAQYLRLLDARGLVVAGEWVLSNDNKTVTFVPAAGIALGQTYRISMAGVRTGLGAPLSSRAVTVKTFEPRRLSVLSLEQAAGGPKPGVIDIDWFTKPGAAGDRTIAVAGTDNRDGYKLHTIDLTDARNPSLLGQAFGGFYLRRLQVLPNVTLPLRTLNQLPNDCRDSFMPRAGGGIQFKGDLVITSQSNIDSSYMNMFDVSNLGAPCLAGSKPLVINPNSGVNDYTRRGTFRGISFGKGITGLGHNDGAAGIMATAEYGLLAVDLGQNIPEVPPQEREEEAMFSGDYHDVLTVGDRLYAFNGNYGGSPTVDVLMPTLSPVAQVVIDDPGAAGVTVNGGRLAYAEDVEVDRNGDGVIAAHELYDFVYVGGISTITIVDVTDRNSPVAVSTIQTPLRTTAMSASADGRTLYLAGRGVSTPDESVLFFDVSNPFASVASDQNNDGRDDRIVYEIPISTEQKEINAISADVQRGLLYLGTGPSRSGAPTTPHGVEVWGIAKHGVGSFNRAPIANAGTDADAVPGTTFTLDGTRSSDPDRDPISYRWRQISGAAVEEFDDPRVVRPTFKVPEPASAADGTLVFELVVNDGYTSSAPDTVTITVKQDELRLTPYVAIVPIAPGNRPLRVQKLPAGGGAPEDVTASDTTYQWLGNGLVPGLDGVPDLGGLLNELNAKLAEKLGIEKIPFRWLEGNEMSVSADGTLSATAAGVGLVRASHDGMTSNFAVVLAGITLSSIDVEPESALTLLSGLVSDAMEKNAPLILTPEETPFFTNKGFLQLENVTFEYLGAGEISLQDLKDAIYPLIEKPLTAALASATGPAAPALAHAFLQLVDGGVNYLGTQMLNPLVSADRTVADVNDNFPLRGIVTAFKPGLTTITATLDLGPIGKQSDAVLTWVTPTLTSVQIKPQVTRMSVLDEKQPGPRVRTFGRFALGHATSPGIAVPPQFSSPAKFLEKVLPGGTARWLNAKIDTTFKLKWPEGDDLLFEFAGNFKIDGGQKIKFDALTLGFYLPTRFLDYQNFDATLVQLGEEKFFDQHLLHQDRAGESPLHVEAQIPFFGPPRRDETAKVVITDGPYLLKELGDQTIRVKPGAVVPFKISVVNPTDQPINDVVLTDEFEVNGVIVNRRTFAVGTIGPRQRQTLFTSERVPDDARGVVRNHVEAEGFPPDVIELPVETLHLTPYVIPFVLEGGSEQLLVELESTTGAIEDVSADPETTYRWILGGTDTPDLDRWANDIWPRLWKAAGVDPAPPIAFADISISPTGMLTANSRGIQIVRAYHKGLPSNVAVVLVGVQLKEIELEPESLFTNLAATVMKNPPLILSKEKVGLGATGTFLTNEGVVLLADAKFQLFDSGLTIKASDVAGALRPALDAVVTAAAGGNPLVGRFAAGVLAKLAALGAKAAATQLLDPFASKKPDIVADLSKERFYKGSFKGVQGGKTEINGTLDLGRFGKASDSVQAIVLPGELEARVDPQVTYLSTTSVAPWPRVRTQAYMTFNTEPFDFEFYSKKNVVPPAADLAREALALLVPNVNGKVEGLVTIDERFQQFQNFRFELKANPSATCTYDVAGNKVNCKASLGTIRLGFTVPAIETPGISLAYQAEAPALFTPHRTANLPADNYFDTEIEGHGSAGESKLAATVDITAFGQATDPDARVIILGGPQPRLFKEAIGGLDPVQPGDQKTFRVTALNPGAEPLVDVVVHDVMTLNGVVVFTQDVPIGRLDPGESKSVELTVTMPDGSGIVRNLVTATGFEDDEVVFPLLPFPIVNEVVTEPRSDWNGDGEITAGDQWVELWTSAGAEEVRAWTLEFTDPNGNEQVFTIDPDDPRIEESTDPRRVVITGFGEMAPNTTLRLRPYHPTATAPVADEVEITGRATSADDEAFARVPDLIDRNSANDFRRQAATRGTANQ